MSVKIRLARGGAKKSPYYRIVVANATSPRDGDFLEKIGTYNPLLDSSNAEKVSLKKERVLHWLSCGAQPTDKVLSFFDKAGMALPAHLEKKVASKKKVYADLAAKRAAEALAKAKSEEVASAE